MSPNERVEAVKNLESSLNIESSFFAEREDAFPEPALANYGAVSQGT